MPSNPKPMKFVASSTDLSAALRAVSRAVGNGRQHPVLSGVLLAAEGGSVRITAYDLELGISAVTEASVAVSGAVVAPHRMLADLISRLDGEAVTLALTGDRLTVTAGASSYALATHDADDFPQLPAVATAATDPLDLTAALAAVLPATSTDISKQQLQGVHLHNGCLEATDGHRLAVWAAGHGADNVVLPARTLALIKGPVSIAIDGAYASLESCGLQIISRLLDGTYPNVQALIPADFKHKALADREDLIHALERIAIVSNNGIVKLKAKNATLEISAEGESNAGIESLRLSGTLPTFAINVQYLITALRAFAVDEVEIRANMDTTPIVIAGDPGQTYLIMPVQIRG